MRSKVFVSLVLLSLLSLAVSVTGCVVARVPSDPLPEFTRGKRSTPPPPMPDNIPPAAPGVHGNPHWRYIVIPNFSRYCPTSYLSLNIPSEGEVCEPCSEELALRTANAPWEPRESVLVPPWQLMDGYVRLPANNNWGYHSWGTLLDCGPTSVGQAHWFKWEAYNRAEWHTLYGRAANDAVGIDDEKAYRDHPYGYYRY
jgi:hypothetical protein